MFFFLIFIKENNLVSAVTPNSGRLVVDSNECITIGIERLMVGQSADKSKTIPMGADCRQWED